MNWPPFKEGRMKKNIYKAIAIILALFAVSPIMAENLQKTYTVRDEAYVRVDSLARRAGVLGPSNFSPMSARALIIALERIDATTLPSQDKAEYDELMNMLEKGDMIYTSDILKIELGLDVNLNANIADYSQLNFFTSTPVTDRREEMLVQYRYDDPLLSIYPKFFFGESVFIEGDFAVGNNSNRLYESSLGWISGGSTIPFVPFKAGLSVGNEYVSMIIGRYPHSIGSGITGNLIAGDNFLYQEMGTLSFLSNHFSYNMSLTRFDQQDEYSTTSPSPVNFSRQEFSGKQQVRSIHRMDATFFDKLRFALDFGTIYNSSYGFDIRYFFPFVLQHNYYNYTNATPKEDYDEANNIMGLMLEYVPVKGLALMAQFILDQYQLPGEDPDSVPIAYGVMANIKYSMLTKKRTGQFVFRGCIYEPVFIYEQKRKHGRHHRCQSRLFRGIQPEQQL